jgi:hypothetical protein
MLDDLATAIYAKLNAASALTALLSSASAIYDDQAKDGAALPCVVFSLQGGGDENETANRTKNMVLYVRAYNSTSMKAAKQIDKQIDAALHGQALSVTGYTNFWLARETDIAATENPPSGGKIYCAGGHYRIRLDKN